MSARFTPKGSAPRPSLPPSVWTFRISSAVVALVVVLQAASAGQLLSGSGAARTVHETVGHLLFELSWVVTISGIIAWRRHGLPGWGALTAGLLPLLLFVQVAMGHVPVLEVHLPLGVSILAVSLFLVWAGLGVQRYPAARAGDDRNVRARQ